MKCKGPTCDHCWDWCGKSCGYYIRERDREQWEAAYARQSVTWSAGDTFSASYTVSLNN